MKYSNRNLIKSLIYAILPLGLAYASEANPINAQRRNETGPYICTLTIETDEHQEPVNYFTSLQNLREITDSLSVSSSYAADLDNDGDAEVIIITNTDFKVLENRIKETEALDRLFDKALSRME